MHFLRSIVVFSYNILILGTNVTLRLRDGGEAYGRLEVLYDGTWGTVCNYNFGPNEAKVVCHQLGFPVNGRHGYTSAAEFGQGSGYTWLYNLDCYGGEENLKDCNHDGWGSGITCSHSRDINVYCDRSKFFDIRMSYLRGYCTPDQFFERLCIFFFKYY